MKNSDSISAKSTSPASRFNVGSALSGDVWQLSLNPSKKKKKDIILNADISEFRY